MALSDTPVSLAFRFLRPSWRNYIQYVDSAARNGDKLMEKYLDIWHRLPFREQQSAMPEQICELAGVKPHELVGAVCGAVWQTSTAEASLVAAIAKPAVMEKIAQYAASDPENFKDRELYCKVTGIMPSKQPGPAHTSNIFVGGAHASVSPSPGPSEPSSVRLLDMDDEIIEISKSLEDAQVPVDSRFIGEEDGTEEEA